jgi:hypothetical protein
LAYGVALDFWGGDGVDLTYGWVYAVVCGCGGGEVVMVISIAMEFVSYVTLASVAVV